MNLIQKKYILENLACANCASKIETKINNIPNVENATVDFISKKLTFQINDEQELNQIENQINAIVRKLEPNVNIIKLDKSKKEIKRSYHNIKENKKKIIKIGISSLLLLIGLVIKLPNMIKFIIFLVSYIIVAKDILLRAINNITKGQIFDENFLMSIATIGAFIIGQYAEGVAVILFYQVGELFQDIAVDNSRRSISDLMDIRPDFANIKVGNELIKVSPEMVNINDIIVVKPGERIPLDGIVIDGNSMIDTSSLTGESVLREVKKDSSVLSGFINKNGILSIEVTKIFSESTVSKILDLVENASNRKAPTEKFITKFSRYYTPIVVISAIFIALIPPLILEDAIFSQWIYRALIFLVISCPCALVVSIPLGFFGGIGAASKSGILIKGSNYLQTLNNLETIVFDKTGTLTKGVFKVSGIMPEKGYTIEELLEYAAYAESYSNHPIALSILKIYNKEIDKSKVVSYEEVSGYGTKVEIKNKKIFAGNAKLMERQNIIYNKIDSIGTVVHVGVNNDYVGYIIISDEIKEDSFIAIKEIKKLKLKKIVMLTGDLKSVGEKIGKELGIDEIYTELLPAEKVEQFEKIHKEKSLKGKIAFVGDGINDAPVLARADIGIAMGGLGSDAAIEAADIVIMTDELSKIVTAIKIAKRTNIIVWQNIIFAIGIKIIFLSLGAFGIANMWEAVFADVGVSVIAVLNSLRAMKTIK